jgi:hypothetical protein
MKTRGRRALACAGLFLALDVLGAATWLAACGSEPPPPTPLGDAGADAADAGNACVIIDASTLDAATVASGLAVVKMHKCFDCHGDALSGNTDGVQYAGDEGGVAYPPNLTQDPDTGLGCWTRDQIITAILYGTDNQGQYICPPMPNFADAGDLTLTSAQAEAVAEFLQSLAPVVNNVDNTNCPPPGSMPPVADGGSDASPTDASVMDASVMDASITDASSADASTMDASAEDAAAEDASTPEMDAASDAPSDAAGE